MANKNYSKTVIDLEDDYTALERRAIADDVIEYLRKRTLAGKGSGDKYGGKKWAGSKGKYSDSYKASDDFKAKSAKGVVNLELSGDMLSSIDRMTSSSSQIAVGIPQSDQDYKKAEGNIRGTYGSKKPNPNKARDFMELSEKEISGILRPYKAKKSRDLQIAAYKAALALAKKVAATKVVVDEGI